MTRNLSINIGLNYVDPDKYNGWKGTLGGCVNDANAMQALAKKNFDTLRLINEQATRAAVIRAVAEAAEQLKSGDTLLITYAGHGGQVPDANGDEEDGKDETWVLYDGMLIDDELYKLWGSFESGVRIVVVSDSCHSGTVFREVREFQQSLSLELMGGTRGNLSVETGVAIGVRLIPPDIAQSVYEAHPEIYAAAQYSSFRGDRTEIGASVILLSGCQDDQLSADTGTNGLFTVKMLDVWSKGKFRGNYSDFISEIRSVMPKKQQPNFGTTGQKNQQFENEKPFTTLADDRAVIGGNGNSFYQRTAGKPDQGTNGGKTAVGVQNPAGVRSGNGQMPDQGSGTNANRIRNVSTSARSIAAPGLEDPDSLRQQNVTTNRSDDRVMRAPGALRDLIMGIDKISVPFESDILNGVGTSWLEQRDGKRVRVTSTPRAAVNTFESLAAFDVHADVLWPGSNDTGPKFT